jgi:hypothetical protein
MTITDIEVLFQVVRHDLFKVKVWMPFLFPKHIRKLDNKFCGLDELKNVSDNWCMTPEGTFVIQQNIRARGMVVLKDAIEFSMKTHIRNMSELDLAELIEDAHWTEAELDAFLTMY